jgi:PleD family two-component response regulator
MPETTAQAAAIFAERLRKSIVCHPMHLDGTAIAATISIWVVQPER